MRLKPAWVCAVFGIVLAGGGVLLFAARPKAQILAASSGDAGAPASHPGESVESAHAASLSDQSIDSGLSSLLRDSENAAAALRIADDPRAVESLRAPLVALSEKSTRPLTDLARARGPSLSAMRA